MQTIRLSQKDLDALPEYSTTNPTGVWGRSGKLKIWKRNVSVFVNMKRQPGEPLRPPEWYVCWYVICQKHPNCAEVESAKAEVIGAVQFYQPLIAHTSQRKGVVATIYSATPIPGWGQERPRYGPNVRGWDPTEFEG